MALTLAEAAKLSQNDLERGVIETFVISSPVLDRLPLKSINGNAYSYTTEGTLPGVEFRAVNSAYAESTGTVNSATEKLVILGGDADVDSFLVRTGGQLADLRAEQTAFKVKSASYKFQDAFFNGDTAVDANSFDGLRKRVTGAQVVDAQAATGTGTGGIPILGAADSDRYRFFDALDAVVAQVPGANAIYASSAVIAKIASSMRRLTMTNEGMDNFGRRVLTFNGIPLLDPGTNAAGASILPSTELYVVKYGSGVQDGGVTGLTNGGVSVRDLGEIDAKPVFRTRIEFFCGVALFGGKAAARLTNFTNA